MIPMLQRKAPKSDSFEDITKFWYKRSVQKTSEVVKEIPALKSILADFADKPIGTKLLKGKIKDRQTIIEKLGLENPPPQKMLQISKVLSENKALLGTNPHVFDSLLPILNKFLINYVVYAQKLLTNSNIPIDQKDLLIDGTCIFTVFSAMPPESSKDAQVIIGQFYDFLYGYLEKQPQPASQEIMSYINAVTKVTTTTLNKNSSSSLFIKQYSYILLMYIRINNLFGTPQYSRDEYNLSYSIGSQIIKLSSDEGNKFKNEIIKPFIVSTNTILHKLVETHPTDEKDFIFENISGFLNFLFSITKIVDITEIISENEIISSFIQSFSLGQFKFPIFSSKITKIPHKFLEFSETSNLDYKEIPDFQWIKQKSSNENIEIDTSTIETVMNPTDEKTGIFLSIISTFSGCPYKNTIIKSVIGLIKNIKDKATKENSSLLRLTIKFFLSYDQNILNQVLVEENFWDQLMTCYMFDKYHTLVSSENGDMKFYQKVRSGIFRLVLLCLKNSNEEQTITILNSIGSLMEFSGPILGLSISKLLRTILRLENPGFYNCIYQSNIIPCYFNYMYKLQLVFLRTKSKKQKEHVIKNPVQFIFNYFSLFEHKELKLILLSSLGFMQFMFHLLYDEQFKAQALELLSKSIIIDKEEILTIDGNKILPFRNFFKLFGTVFNHSSEDIQNEDSFYLANNLINLLTKGIIANRKTLVNQFKKYDILPFLINSLQICINKIGQKSYELLLNLVKLILNITKFDQSCQQFVYCKPLRFLDKVSNLLSQITFEDELINVLLETVFEVNIRIKQLPELVETRFYKALPYLHMSIIHLPQYHSKIMNYLSVICEKSFTNCLHVYQSKLLIIILNYIQQFPDLSTINNDRIESIFSSLGLFYTVSSFIIKPRVFIEATSLLKPYDNKRVWWTYNLISGFHNILEQDKSHLPSSFIHFGGIETGLTLPKLTSTNISKGFSIVIKLNLELVNFSHDKEPRLLYIKTSNNSIIEIIFRNGNIFICTQYGQKKQKNVTNKIEFEFKTNVWYTFGMSYQNGDFKVFINGNKITTFNIPNLKIENIESLYIAKSLSSNYTLTCNINVIYIFSQYLNTSIMKAIASLPLDYIYSFLPSNINLFPSLPQILFNGDIESILLLCYNSRMAIGKNILNISSNNINKNASIEGDIVPFSSTLVNDMFNMEGILRFIPLLEQVDIPQISSKGDTDNLNFFNSLINLFISFILYSKDFEDLFFNVNGMKSFSHLCSKINPNNLTNEFLDSMYNLCYSLKLDQHKSEMLKLFWLNYDIWRKKDENFHNIIVSDVLLKFLENSTNLFINTFNFIEIFTYINLMNEEEKREKYWPFLISFSKKRFEINEQEFIYQSCFILTNLKVKLETLNVLYILFTQRIFNCQLLFSKKQYISSFIYLSSDFEEDFRIIGFKFIILAYQHLNKGFLNNLPNINETINSYIDLYNKENITIKTWNETIELFFDTPELMKNILPFISFISYEFNSENIYNFINKLYEYLMNNENEQFINSNWYIYIFYLFLQMSKPILNITDNNYLELIINLFAIIMIKLLNNQNSTHFQSIIGFFHIIQYIKHWNMNYILEKIFLKILNIYDSFIENVYNILIPEIFSYLFFIPNYDEFYYNLDLYNKYNIKNPIKNEKIFDVNLTFKDFINKIQNYKESFNVKTSLSIRTLNNYWYDNELGIKLIDIIEKEIPILEKTIIYNKISLTIIELLTYSLSNVIKMNHNLVEKITQILSKVFSRLNTDLFLKCTTIFTSYLYPITCNNQSTKIYLDNFINLIIQSHQKVKELNGFLPDFYGINSSEWLTTLTTISENYNIIYTQLLNKTLQNIINSQVKIENLDQYPSVDEDSFYNIYEINGLSYIHNSYRCSKAYEHLKKELNANYGYNSLNNTENIKQHWKLSLKLDNNFRHCQLQINDHFDLHQMASILRDSRTKEEANNTIEQLKLNNNIIINNINETSNDNDIDENNNLELENYSFSFEAKLIKLNKTFEGKLFINKNQIFFNGTSNEKVTKSIEIRTEDLDMILQRNYLHIPCGLEFFIIQKKSYLIIFPNENIKKNIIRILQKYKLLKLRYFQINTNYSLIEESNLTEDWLNGKISNYEYLIYLNLFSGRSFNDLTQYPIFPWVLKDYTSETIDLNDPNVYRDLSKPIGALNDERLEHLLELVEEMDEENKFLYKVHYSNSYFVTYYLLRLEPYTTINIKMQDNKFDQSSRIFSSIPILWETVTSSTITDFRELIPEFFTTPKFLINSDNFDLGLSVDGNKINDVILPNWAKDNYDFIQIHREALESEYVSLNLSKWIDLIFGYKQNGIEAKLANNTFHPFTYSTYVTPEVMNDQNKLQQCQQFAALFGVIPNQLFKTQHPSREKTNLLYLNIFNLKSSDLQYKLNSKPIFIKSKNDNIIIVTEDGNLNYNNIIETKLNQCIINNNDLLIEKSFSYCKEKKLFFETSSMDSIIRIYQINDDNIKLINSKRQNSLIHSIIVSSTKYLVTTSKDSSITVWSLKKSQPNIEYQICPHSSSIVDFDVSFVSNLILCAYKTKKIILNNLNDGSYLHSINMELQISKVMLTQIPSVVIVLFNGKRNIKVVSLGIDLELINEINFNDSVNVEICEIILNGKNSLLAMADRRRHLYLLSLPKLNIEKVVEVESNVTTIDYDDEEMALVYGCENYNVYKMNLN